MPKEHYKFSKNEQRYMSEEHRRASAELDLIVAGYTTKPIQGRLDQEPHVLTSQEKMDAVLDDILAHTPIAALPGTLALMLDRMLAEAMREVADKK